MAAKPYFADWGSKAQLAPLMSALHRAVCLDKGHAVYVC